MFQIIPLIHTIEHFLEHLDVRGTGLQGLKNDVISSLKRRYASVEENINFGVATLLDPRFKATPFKKADCLEAAKKRVLEEMESSASTPTPTQVSSEPEPSDQKEISFWSHYVQAFAGVNPVEEHVSTCESELKMYLSEKALSTKENIFPYWEKTNFLRLKEVATKYICIPPATAFSERLFSTAGLICDKKRNRPTQSGLRCWCFYTKICSRVAVLQAIKTFYTDNIFKSILTVLFFLLYIVSYENSLILTYFLSPFITIILIMLLFFIKEHFVVLYCILAKL